MQICMLYHYRSGIRLENDMIKINIINSNKKNNNSKFFVAIIINKNNNKKATII